MVRYPYLPHGYAFKFVPADHPCMQAAAKARAECAGDSLFPVGIVLARGGEVIARAGNGFNQKPQKHLCPRILAGCKTGEGYDLCHLHDAEGHSEPMLMKVAREANIPTEGADVYMYGHWWMCEPCWNVLIDAGISDAYLVENAHELFSRENVYRETLADYPDEVRKRLGLF